MITDTDIVIDEKIKQTIQEPSLYNVIFLNDNQTPMDWVIDILQDVYRHSYKDSEGLTLKIHEEGSAVVGTYSFEIAEMKGIETTNLSRANGFPLQVRIEQE